MLRAVASAFTIKQGDTAPALHATLTDSAGTVIDVTGATIQFQMKLREHLGNEEVPLKVDAAGAIVNGTGGIVKYDWVAGDTDTEGDYAAEFRVTFAGGTIRTVPNPSFITVRVVGDV